MIQVTLTRGLTKDPGLLRRPRGFLFSALRQASLPRSENKKPRLNFVETGSLCPRLDSNQHTVSGATTSRWCVYQFRHPGRFTVEKESESALHFFFILFLRIPLGLQMYIFYQNNCMCVQSRGNIPHSGNFLLLLFYQNNSKSCSFPGFGTFNGKATLMILVNDPF